MEDGVTEIQSLLPPLNHSSEDGSKSEGNEEKEEGFVSTEKAEKVKQEDLGRENTGQDCVAEGEAKDNCGGGGGGGLINNLISTLITPLSPRRTGKATEQPESGNGVFESEEGTADGERRGGVDNGGEGAGLISTLVSNFFHRSECEEGVVEIEKDKEEEEIIADEKIKRLKTENEANNSGGGGIIHDIVSSLPVPGDAIPTADEATILINSLVRD